MTKVSQLGICNRLLPWTGACVLVTSVGLEATGCRVAWTVWLHAAISAAFLALALWHLYLHFGAAGWIGRLLRLPSRVTRYLALFGLLTLVSAVAAGVHRAAAHVHVPLGGIHGKIGLVFLVLAAVHTAGRRRFYAAKRSRR